MGIFKKTYQEEIIQHYEKQWKNNGKMYLWDRGNFEKLPYDFRVLEFAPNNLRNMWTYATCAMSQPDDEKRIELHLFSSKRDEGLIEVLTAIAYYHRNTAKIGLGHTVNFGKPWQDESLCEYGFVSLPYLDGPSLENLENNRSLIKCYWLIPVTENEVDFKSKNGVEELEYKFDEAGLDYINPNRLSLI
jgi:hypothetical protein